ncbi:hypothetical protein [uncultured Salinicola sp.]|uniref:hypothetical protein n=1 Tax=uncultured Salinicola sp. TaxID=1193542 RepID=UPI002605BA84|nr:hypothetical protein [uncultured Salinicola sp.]|tara:strand:- start:2386 stop:2556 length:171 start_codon:yes stop_codon:yes gene_type:complete
MAAKSKFAHRGDSRLRAVNAGHVISAEERQEMRDAARSQKKSRIARNRAIKKSKGK